VRPEWAPRLTPSGHVVMVAVYPLPESKKKYEIIFGLVLGNSSERGQLRCATPVGLMDNPVEEGQLAPKKKVSSKKVRKTQRLSDSSSAPPRLAEALADDDATAVKPAATPAKSAKGAKAATPAVTPAAPPKPVFQGTIGFLAPRKALCRCIESALVRGMRVNVSRIVLAFWTAEAQKSIKVKAALKKMTPEGRAMSGAWRSWYAKLLEHRRMKAVAAKMSPEGRAKGHAFAKWINDLSGSRLKVAWLNSCPCGQPRLQMPARLLRGCPAGPTGVPSPLGCR
jgi:hypothetical protein